MWEEDANKSGGMTKQKEKKLKWEKKILQWGWNRTGFEWKHGEAPMVELAWYNALGFSRWCEVQITNHSALLWWCEVQITDHSALTFVPDFHFKVVKKKELILHFANIRNLSATKVSVGVVCQYLMLHEYSLVVHNFFEIHGDIFPTTF